MLATGLTSCVTLDSSSAAEGANRNDSIDYCFFSSSTTTAVGLEEFSTVACCLAEVVFSLVVSNWSIVALKCIEEGIGASTELFASLP